MYYQIKSGFSSQICVFFRQKNGNYVCVDKMTDKHKISFCLFFFTILILFLFFTLVTSEFQTN